jgi:ribonucleoside-triphosphate reductase
MKYVRKRDGRLEAFDRNRIAEAIWKAAKAVGGRDRSLAERLADQVVEALRRRFGEDGVPTVEEIQDAVEKVLVENGHYRTAKAYILYRKQHQDLREVAALMSQIELVESYMDVEDWRVKENANMTYSLQGLNNYLSGSVVANYWLNKIYPPEVAQAHREGDMHIHNLSTLAAYCCGWDLADLLMTGFKGVSGKVASRPAKHFRTALLQMVNFLFTLQNETAGAQAFSYVDVYLAPYVRADGLGQREVDQSIQEFIFNMNVPTRVGGQCLSEDTKILTPEGWKSYNEVKVGDQVYTFNVKTKKLELKPVKYVYVGRHNGIMYRLRNRTQDQLISPGHRVVRLLFNTENYKLEPIEECLKLKSGIYIPTPAVTTNENPDAPISDELLKLTAWILSEGYIEKVSKNSYRLMITQSDTEHPDNFKEITELLKQFNAKFTIRRKKRLGTGCDIRLTPASSKPILRALNNEKKPPAWLYRLSRRQARIFLETFIKGDGCCERYRRRIVTTSQELAEALAAVAVLAGFNCSIRMRIMKPPSKKVQYYLTITESKHDATLRVSTVNYDGIIWCVHTENETVVAKRGGCIFITGNTPFSNVTLGAGVPEFMKDMPAVVGGEASGEAYGEYEREVEMFNRAFAKVMCEGDAEGRVFTFPIPTYNIAGDFEWEGEVAEGIFEMSAKYGIPYFANFMNSDMRPEDVRSMCCRLRLDTRELRRRGGGLFGADPLTGSIGVVTINMPRIGYMARSEEGRFWERLDGLMCLAKDSLEIKRKILERYTERNLYPYCKFYLRHVRETRGQYWTNHFSTIGLIGMNEALLNMLGVSIAEPEGVAFAERVLEYMRGRLIEFQEETGNMYNLEATPAEGTSYRLARIDKKRYPDIIVANEGRLKDGAAPFYTNSTQLPVDFEGDLFEALELQDRLQALYTGGTVFHIWLGERLPSWREAALLVRRIFQRFRMPYVTLTPTFSICPSHGYISGERRYCPRCGARCEVYSRVVGYLRPVDQWNEGKQSEFLMRRTYEKTAAIRA